MRSHTRINERTRLSGGADASLVNRKIYIHTRKRDANTRHKMLNNIRTHVEKKTNHLIFRTCAFSKMNTTPRVRFRA